mmetsp:Transcript_2369/g.3511  ORF Transcript_2369/g.3511 Transcript_2369/m.3511 type:complete len:83 (-) Transcript_2369:90-338(-)
MLWDIPEKQPIYKTFKLPGNGMQRMIRMEEGCNDSDDVAKFALQDFIYSHFTQRIQKSRYESVDEEHRCNEVFKDCQMRLLM